MDREQKVAIISEMLQNHDTLSPQLFDEHDFLLPVVREKFLHLADLINHRFLSFFPQTKIVDIIFTGSMCSYTYASGSDIDFFIVVDTIMPDNPMLTEQILGDMSGFLSKMEWKPKIYNHCIDYGLIDVNNMRYGNINTYSVQRNEWNYKPIHQDYEFTAEDLLDDYTVCFEQLSEYVDSLPKTEDNFLTSYSCTRLSRRLDKLRIQAHFERHYSRQHEYNRVYNLYRVLKRFGFLGYLSKYIYDSKSTLLERGKDD